MKCEVIPCHGGVDDWRVEAIDENNEGVIYVTCFSGPDAERRAREYAAWVNARRRPEIGTLIHKGVDRTL